MVQERIRLSAAHRHCVSLQSLHTWAENCCESTKVTFTFNTHIFHSINYLKSKLTFSSVDHYSRKSCMTSITDSIQGKVTNSCSNVTKSLLRSLINLHIHGGIMMGKMCYVKNDFLKTIMQVRITTECWAVIACWKQWWPMIGWKFSNLVTKLINVQTCVCRNF